MSGLQPGDEDDQENFELALDFSLSQLKHHSFLEVNPAQVERNYSSLKHRFEIASQLRKRDRLEREQQRFSQTYQSPELFPEARASVLSLLYQLADSPLSTVLPVELEESRPAVGVGKEEGSEGEDDEEELSEFAEDFEQWNSDGSELSDWDADDGEDNANNFESKEEDDQSNEVNSAISKPETRVTEAKAFRFEDKVEMNQEGLAKIVSVLDGVRNSMHSCQRAFVQHLLPPTTEEDLVFEIIALFTYGNSTENFLVVEDNDTAIRIEIRQDLALRHISPQSMKNV